MRFRSKPQVVVRRASFPKPKPSYFLWQGDVDRLMDVMPARVSFDLVVTSPPYNIGKAYEKSQSLGQYLDWQERIIDRLVERLKPTGSICWQVGSRSENGTVEPLDYFLFPIFKRKGLQLRNRIIWRFGHGLHRRHRFSGRHEVVLWFTKSDRYTFNLDAVRIPPKYPAKRAYRGPRVGSYSCHPLGKNPEDVWDIPNVNGRHVEKTDHPCQFPVALAERLVLALTNKGGVVFDPFCGSGSAGVAAAIHSRRFWGADTEEAYVALARRRLAEALRGSARYRPHDREIFDHRRSRLSIPPNRASER